MIKAFKRESINYKALTWTIIVHGLLLLLFILLHYNFTKSPPVQDNGGLEVNLGTSETGNGQDQPMKHEKPKEFQAVVVYKNYALRNTVSKNILQTNDVNAPAININNKKDNNKTEQTQNPDNNQPQAQPRYTYQGETGKGGNDATDDKRGTNEGNDKGPGDKGVPNGTPGAANYTGVPGNGSGGIGHTLTGRQIKPDKFEAEFRESGKVVIHVTVDRNGNIVDKRIVSSSSAQLTKIALEKLGSARFSKSENSEPQQFGDVTIIFKTH